MIELNPNSSQLSEEQLTLLGSFYEYYDQGWGMIEAGEDDSDQQNGIHTSEED